MRSTQFWLTRLTKDNWLEKRSVASRSFNMVQLRIRRFKVEIILQVMREGGREATCRK